MKSKTDSPKLPCPDPEGCKHFQEQVRLELENRTLKNLLLNYIPPLQYEELLVENKKLREFGECNETN